jgi:hypothetical protein
VLDAAGATVATQEITLSDNPGPQEFDVRAGDAVTIRVEVSAVTNTNAALPAALGEVEFLVRK